jgi:hypothetical protein
VQTSGNRRRGKVQIVFDDGNFEQRLFLHFAVGQ